MKVQSAMPPKLFLRFFRWYCHPRLRDHIEGDLIEVYNERLRTIGEAKANRKFIIDVVLLFRPGIVKPIKRYKTMSTYGMYKSHVKIGWRNIFKDKNYAFINIGGLALSLACALVIFSVVDYHLGFDNFHQDPERIYRFVTESHRDQVSYSEAVPPAFGNAFRNDYSFGEKVARVCTLTEKLVTAADGEIMKFKEQISFADPDFFDIFNFPLVSNTRDTPLREPNTAIITSRIARKYFGNEVAVGKTLRFDNRIDFTITGLLKDIPVNTHLRSEIYFSYSTLKQHNHWYAADDSWGGITTDIQAFVKLQPGITSAEVESVLPTYVKKYRADSKNVHHYKLQPLDDIHFNSLYGARVSKSIILVLAFIGLLLIVVACLNFVNLATAQAISRSKEVGVRRTLGSSGRQLFLQFSTETGLIVVLSTIVATGVAYVCLPYINGLFNTDITLQLFSDSKTVLFLLAVILLVTFLSSAYPGVILSRFRPVIALKGKVSARSAGGVNVRRGMIITQFTIAQILLIGLIVVVHQVRHFKQTDMGFIKDAVVMIPVGTDRSKVDLVKTQFSQIPGVEDVTVCLAAPASDGEWSGSFRFDNRSEKEDFSVSFKSVDDRYLSTFGLELVAGRNLTPSDTIREFLANEKLLTRLGLTSPEEILGKHIALNGDEWRGPVVGVVRDFHDQSLRSDIQPMVMGTNKDYYNVFAVRISLAEVRTTLDALQQHWSEAYPENLYEYGFLDDQIAAFYKVEETILKLIQVCSLIALLIGCTGMYGLVSLMAVQKTKEIGIRKVLGGDISDILWIFIKEYLLVLVVAFVLAAPVAWELLSRWLENYPYHVEMTPWLFLLEILIMFFIVALTVGYQSLKAARMNPVRSLRTE